MYISSDDMNSSSSSNSGNIYQQSELSLKYGFLSEEEETKIIRLICNHLSLGQFELARALILQIQQPQQSITTQQQQQQQSLNEINNESNIIAPSSSTNATNVSTNLSMIRKVSSILHHTIKNGPPSTWLTSDTIPSSSHISWLCAIEFYQLNKDGFVQSISERILILLEFAILLYSTLDQITQTNEYRSVLPIIQELREYHFVLLHQALNQQQPNGQMPNNAAGMINMLSSRLSSNTVALLKRTLVSNGQLAKYLLTQLTDPFVSLDNGGMSLLRSVYPVSSQLESIAAEIISHLIQVGQYTEAYNLLKVIDFCDDSSLDNSNNNSNSNTDSLDSSSKSTVLTRLLERIAHLNVDRVDYEQPANFGGDRLLLEKIPFTSKTDTSILDFTKSTTLSRLPVYQSLLSNRTLNPLKRYTEFEEQLLLDSNNSFSEVFESLRQYQQLKSNAAAALTTPDQISSPTSSTTTIPAPTQLNSSTESLIELNSTKNLDDFWYWYYHFLRVNDKHFLEYALNSAVQLAKEKQFDKAMLVVKPFGRLLPMVVLMCWDHFAQDISARKALVNLMASAKRDQMDETLLHANDQLEYLVEMSEWCCKKMIAVPNSPGGNRLIVGDSQFDMHNRDITGTSSSSKMIEEISNAVINQLGQQSFVYVIKDCLPFITSNDILQLIESDPDYPMQYNSEHQQQLQQQINGQQQQNSQYVYQQQQQQLSNIALEKLNDMNLVRGYYLTKSILRFFQYRTRESAIDQNEFDLVLEDVFQLFKGISDSTVAIGLVEAIYLSLFLSNHDLKQDQQTASLANSTLMGIDDSINIADVIQRERQIEDYNNLKKHIGSVGNQSGIEDLTDSLNAFDNSYGSQFDAKVDHKSYYITSSMMSSLIDTLIKIIAYITNVNDNHRESVKERIQILSSNLENLKHRVSIANWVISKIRNMSFMRLVLMPVHSLLSICMRTNYPNLQKILEYYQTPKDIQTDVSQYLSIPNLIEKLSNLKDNEDVSVDSLEYKGISKENLFTILCDVVLGSNLNDSLISRVLNIASSTKDNNKVDTIQSEDRHIQYIEWILALHQQYTDHSLLQILTNVQDNYPPSVQTTKDTVAFIQKKRILINSLNHLIQNIYDPAKNNNSKDNNSNQQKMSSIGEIIENGNPGNATSNTSNLLSMTFKYLLSINSIMEELSDLSTESNQYSSRNFANLISTMETSPSKIMEKIIFQEQNYQKAEKMARFMQIDLADFIISSISHTAPKNPPNALFSSTTPEASIIDSPIYYVNKTHPSATSDLTTYQSLPSISSADQPNNTLSMNLVRYLGNTSKLLSCVACMLKAPSDGVDIEPFLQYAMEESKQLPNNVLLNWIKEILRAHTFYYRHFGGSQKPPPAFLTQDNLDYDLQATLISSPPLPDELPSFNMILNSESIHQHQTFFFKIIQHFVSHGRLIEALNIADEFLEEGAPDWLLKLMVMKDKTQGYVYIRRMKDKEKAINLVLELYHNWEVDVAIDMLVISRSNVSESNQAQELTHLHQCLLIYQSILNVDRGSRWRSWQEVKDLCRRDPTKMVRSLLESKHYELARQIRDLFQVSNIRNEIEESYLFYLLVEKDDASLALQTLSTLGEESIPIATGVLPKLRDVSLRLFLVQFLLSNMRLSLSEERLAELIKQETGYKVLLVLPNDLQKEYEHFTNHPNLILEMLVMNEKIPLVSKLLAEIKELKNDDLLAYYGRKALSFGRYMAKNDILVVDDYLQSSEYLDNIPQDKSHKLTFGDASPKNITIGSPNQIKEKQLKTQKWVLTGMDIKDEKVRHNHFFVRSPSISLAKSLFDLCESKKKVYTTCLDLYSYLSELLSSSYSDDNLLIINLIQQLLMYTKLQLLRDPKSGGPTFVAVCDTLLGKVELFQSLVISKCSGSMSLADLSDMQKARQLRDKLIQEDRLKLAIDVATKCNIPADPAWVAWGITLIQLGQYNDAREKFKYCLSSSGDRRVMSPSTTLSPDNVDSSVVLTQIIQLLETPPTANHSNLRNLFNQFKSQPLNNPKSIPKIDDQLFYGLLTPSLNTNHGSFTDVAKVTSPLSSSTGLNSSNNNKLKQSIGKDSVLNISNSKPIDPNRLEEAIYYLKKYGSARMHINFLMKHGFLELALRTITSENFPSSVFFEEIVMHAISSSSLPDLFSTIKVIDQSLITFHEHLFTCCKIMNEKKWYAMLFEFQLYMGDNIRAGLTQIKIFMEATDPAQPSRIQHLEQALHYFHLGQNQKGVLPELEINKYIQKLQTQIDVSKFLYAQKGLPPNVHKLTMFGVAKEKNELAELVTIYNNFELGFKLAMEYKLSLPVVYTNALSAMARKKNYSKTEEVLNNLRNFIDPSDWDSIAMSVIEILCLEMKELKVPEKFIPKLHSARNSVRVCILCNKLKSAYLKAVQMQDKDLIIMVMEEAQRTNQTTIINYCKEVLSGSQPKTN